MLDGEATTMSYCDHCAGQRFDRAQVLRTLRAARREARLHGRATRVETALAAAIRAVRALEIPHLDFMDEVSGDEVVH
jgi:hypothetical protein